MGAVTSAPCSCLPSYTLLLCRLMVDAVVEEKLLRREMDAEAEAGRGRLLRAGWGEASG